MALTRLASGPCRRQPPRQHQALFGRAGAASTPPGRRPSSPAPSPLIFGGDFNVRPKASEVFDQLEERFGLAPRHRPGPAQPPARARPQGDRASSRLAARGARRGRPRHGPKDPSGRPQPRGWKVRNCGIVRTMARAATETEENTRAEQSVQAFRDALEKSITISRDRLQEVVDDAVRRGRMTRGDAEEMVGAWRRGAASRPRTCSPSSSASSRRSARRRTEPRREVSEAARSRRASGPSPRSTSHSPAPTGCAGRPRVPGFPITAYDQLSSPPDRPTAPGPQPPAAPQGPRLRAQATRPARAPSRARPQAAGLCSRRRHGRTSCA